MSYLPSVNIEHNKVSDFHYVVTENAKIAAGNILNGFGYGHHCFSIIGTYGTGKSSFILALEDDLSKHSNRIINADILSSKGGFEFMKIVGDYTKLSLLLSHKLNCQENEVLEKLKQYYNTLKSQQRFLFIVIDEFGKVLEYAAKHNPEKELYFFQKLAEFVNVPNRRIILLTTLHQNFGSYFYKLKDSERNEWLKVKGRFKEIVFVEPIEQLLELSANEIKRQIQINNEERENLETIYKLGVKSKIIGSNLTLKSAEKLYPLDAISASCICIAIQRYGQNQRTLFDFINDKNQDSINSFCPQHNLTYNTAYIYDYIKYHFYSAISEANADSLGWRALTISVDRIERSELNPSVIEECKRMIKTIGIINMFFNGVILDRDFLNIYGKEALGIENVEKILDYLTKHKIIRYASYKSQYILFEGTNIDLEAELYRAASKIAMPSVTIDEIAPYFNHKIVQASASYYRTGTPRYFEMRIGNYPDLLIPSGDIDGFIQLIFPLSEVQKEVIDISSKPESGANIFGVYQNTDEISNCLYEIKKLEYVISHIAFDDHVAKFELENQRTYEIRRLNEILNQVFNGVSKNIKWYFQGKSYSVNSLRQFNRLLSYVCRIVYNKTPIIQNELINRQKLSSSISLARVNLLDAMINHYDEEDFAITSFPPEKTIYYTLLKNTGIHRQDDNGNWVLGEPSNLDIATLWEISIKFLNDSVDKPRKITDLVKTLQKAPYKLKQGVIDFWIPIFLFINQQDFALYNGSTFVLNINKEVFELLQKRMSDFTVRSYRLSGVKLDFFKKYRQFLQKDDEVEVTSETLVETVKPFFHFYRRLNNYAKSTRKFESPYTSRFRDVLSKAVDPQKTFFEDLPLAFGYSDLKQNEFISHYLELIKNAVRELNCCYDALIDRLEEKVVDHLGLEMDFESYKPLLEKKYKHIDRTELLPKTRVFVERVLSPSNSKKEFFEKIALIIIDKRLEEINDEEEPILIQQMLHLFSQLERLSSLENLPEDDSEAFSFELASNKGVFFGSQTFRLPKNKSEQVEKVIRDINRLLTNDDDLNIGILLKLLNQKLK